MRHRRMPSPRPRRATSLTQTFNRDGVMVRTHCRKVIGQLGERYEIVLEGFVRSAIIDIPPGHDEAGVRALLESAVTCFVASEKLRIASMSWLGRGASSLNLLPSQGRGELE